MALKTRKITFSGLLPAAAIVVPAALLALLGWRASRAESLLLRDRFAKDQAAIVRLVSARLSEEARKAVDDLVERARHRPPDHRLEASFVAAHPLARHVFVVRGGRLIYPAPPKGDAADRDPGDEMPYFAADVRRYISRLKSLRLLRTLVTRGLRAEYGGHFEEAARYYRRTAARRGAPAARALLGLARVERRRGAAGAARARRAYADLRRRFGNLRDGEGVAFGLLADVGRAELSGADALLEVHRRLRDGVYVTSAASRRFYLRWVVERLEQRVARARVERIKRRTEALFASDRFGEVLRRYGIGDRQAIREGIGALSIGPQTMLVTRRQGELVVGFALDAAALRQRVAAQQTRLVPSGHAIRLALGRPGERLAPALQRRLVHAEALESPLGHWTLFATRSAADPLAAIERRGRLRHFGMVAGLILVLAAGLFFTYRGVRREWELAGLKSDFASNVSHELKTPLTSIRMYAEMLQQNIAATPADQQRYHEVIIREAERLGRLIANVLDFSRVERGTRSYDLRREDLVELTAEAVETFCRLSADEGASVRFDRKLVAAGEMRGVHRGRPLVTADREAAVQSMLNLLSNAAKYSREDPEIRVRLLEAADGWLGVEVADRGIGIPAGEQQRIFDDFYRAPQAREVGVEGTGLGLALVRRHMAAYGGRVEVQSAVGQGSRFTLWFRAAVEREQEE